MQLFHEGYRLKKMAQLAQHAERVLDIGCTAMPNPYLHNSDVIGFDLAHASLPDNYTHLIRGDVDNILQDIGPNSFDAICAGELLEHLENPVDVLRHCHALLKPVGRVILSTPNPNNPFERFLTITLNTKHFYAADHVMLYPQRWLVRILKIAGFKKVRLYSGGMIFPIIGLIPFFRPWCYQTIATAEKFE
ncbi:MAG: class I SAM-dependent methyltransferase [bacterium]|nr:class I SAM-dependent methyltransferase [bacterium]